MSIMQVSCTAVSERLYLDGNPELLPVLFGPSHFLCRRGFNPEASHYHVSDLATAGNVWIATVR